MNSTWQDYLQQKGARFSENEVADFGYPVNEKNKVASGPILMDLSNIGLIEVKGALAETFLQGQMSCDMREVIPGHTRLGAYCTPQGRIQAFFRIFQSNPECYHLSLPRNTIAALLPVLQKYAQLSKVTVRESSHEWVHLGYVGEPQGLVASFGKIPSEVNSMITTADGIHLIRVPGILPQFEIWGSAAATIPYWPSLTQQATPVGSAYWDWFLIQAGVPQIGVALTEKLLPHDVNLPALAAVSFKKGCYRGQEIIARMHYRGKPKRHLYRVALDQVTLATSPLPPPASPVVGINKTHQETTPVGTWIMAAYGPSDTCEGLAVIEDKALEQPFYLELPTGKIPLKQLDLPYSPEI